MSYQLKYLKYKTKYLALTNKIQQLGGTITAKAKFDTFVKNGKLKETPFIIEESDNTLVTEFFTKVIKTDPTGLLPINTIDDYIGKLNMDDSDLNKLGFYYKQKPENNVLVNILNPVYSYKVNNDNIIPLNKSIKYNSQTNKMSVNDIDVIPPLSPPTNILVILYSIAEKIVPNKEGTEIEGGIKKTFTAKSRQTSGYIDADSFLRTNSGINTLKILTNLTACFGIPSQEHTVTNIDRTTKIYNYYKEHNLLIMLTQDDDVVKYRMYYIKQDDDEYKIFPHSYLNPILNDLYSPPIKNLFKNITQTLNKIKNNADYFNSPDRFFHIHITPVNNENYVLLTLHALYEIENTTNKKDIFKYQNQTITRFSTAQLTQLPANKMTNRQAHNFYILYNMTLNEHFIYNVENIWNDEDYYFDKKAIGIKETIFGTNIADLNYLGDNYNVLVSRAKLKCEWMCDADKTEAKP